MARGYASAAQATFALVPSDESARDAEPFYSSRAMSLSSPTNGNATVEPLTAQEYCSMMIRSQAEQTTGRSMC